MTRDKAGLRSLSRADTFRALQSREYLTASISLALLDHQQRIWALCIASTREGTVRVNQKNPSQIFFRTPTAHLQKSSVA